MTHRPMVSPWGVDSSEDESEEAQLLNPGTQKSYRTTEQQYIREHEEGLDKLGQAIKRQKYMATEIATEVDVHNEILENIDDGLARTDENLRKNTRNIKRVLKKSSTIWLWLLIVILAIVIVALAII
uniref:Syntaxin-8 n=1 Tax=Aceria tosichella TaxID=561515 RepID=A0A6G1SB18_9ACAR